MAWCAFNLLSFIFNSRDVIIYYFTEYMSNRVTIEKRLLMDESAKNIVRYKVLLYFVYFSVYQIKTQQI